MSFWTDADDDQGFTPSFPSSFAEADTQDEARCLNCGSADFYVDDSTGVTHCSDCFTQSQTLSQVDVIGEEDVHAIAARSGGRMMARRTGGGARRRLDPDDGLDSSSPLPDLTSCCRGMQMVLKMTADRAAILAGLDDDRGKSAMMETVKAIWFGYLMAWRRGAKRYKAKYPQLRFSMRDYFLGEHRRRMILRHLSAGSSGNVSVEGEVLNRKPVNVPTAPTTSKAANLKRSRPSPCHSSSYSNVVTMLNSLPSEMMDAEQAALRLQPSMALVGSIVLLALVRLRAGVSSEHITAWAINGSLPYLLNAFVHLPRETQENLKPIQSFFAQDMVPTAGVLEYQLDLLAIACNMQLERPTLGLERARENTEESKATLNGDLDRATTHDDGQGKKKRPRISTNPYIDNIAVEAARLVSDLGFGQRVLDTTLALMGLHRVSTTQHDQSTKQPWTPPSLKGASIEQLISPLHITAVIAVAVKMCRGWEEWFLGVPSPKQYERSLNAPQEKELEENSDSDSYCSVIARLTRTSSLAASSQKGVKRNSVNDSKQRFVPCTEAQLGLVSNGRLLNGYCDFVEESIICDMSVSEPIAEFLTKFQKRMNQKERNVNPESALLFDDESVVEPNSILAGATNPNSPCISEKPNGTADPVFSTWSDANAFGEYVVYNDGLTESREQSNLSKPFHPHYGLLIEYMAFKANAEPSDLHQLISDLDREVTMMTNGKIK